MCDPVCRSGFSASACNTDDMSGEGIIENRGLIDKDFCLSQNWEICRYSWVYNNKISRFDICKLMLAQRKSVLALDLLERGLELFFGLEVSNRNFGALIDKPFRGRNPTAKKPKAKNEDFFTAIRVTRSL